jgi:uncharacterized membrane protein YfcA
MTLFFAVAVVVAGSYIQSSIGFGLAVIAAPILFFIDPAYVPAPVTLCAFTLSLANAWSHRESVSFKGVKYAILGRIPGSAAGALLLLWIDQDLLGLWLGITVLMAVALSIKTFALTPTKGHMLTAGFFSGFMGTSSSIGGPPMALVMQHQDARFVRANLAAFFIVSSLMTLMMLIPVGYFGTEQLTRALPLLPGTLLGYWLARKTWHLVSPKILRYSTLVLCSFCGLFAMVSFWV